MKVPVLILSVMIILLNTCSVTGPIFKDQEMMLSVDAEVTETWITLETDGPVKNAVYTVKRDSIVIFEGKLDKSDTLIHDENIEPSTNYNYSAYARKSGEKSETIFATCTTMDTTSHDFTIEKYEWSGIDPSYLIDVEIVDENNIWAVGEIYQEDTYTFDSLGNFINPYNAIHWDGERWDLKWIKTKSCGGADYPPIRVVFSFDSNNILFGHTDGSITYYINNTYINDCSLIKQLNTGADYIWGRNRSDFYICGFEGLLAHYDRPQWIKIKTNSQIDVNDIWGVIDKTTDEPYIIMPLGDKFYFEGSKLLSLKNDNVKEESWPFTENIASSVWFKNRKRIFVSGGLYTRNRINEWKKFDELPKIAVEKVRGNDINDLFIAGHFGLLAHYNGNTWKYYTEFNEVDVFLSVAVKGNIVIAVGRKGRNAVIYVLKRN